MVFVCGPEVEKYKIPGLDLSLSLSLRLSLMLSTTSNVNNLSTPLHAYARAYMKWTLVTVSPITRIITPGTTT